ncbi:hypothetical protein [Cupriavidus taiwanensis]|uniref:hypothetical protein n=1 Tax=Cupriavidus taiwanensis TaxID=164546 RepID=UPI000E10A616|nr:hypothetical protein [Cupriavidus taiwanensis]SOY56797.1 hypothetical protein CBM2592_A90092 [Cupriavidus taiwanensis]SOY90698.1 hypothetical protein CBM2591_A90091 [Cupriavidus taiwanensis]SOZ63504.1 hypothetical protein CBM2617_A70068 [Cupriavidus taiwanensis]SOZ82506.1 hypothetical protein CBM2618_A80068 [Cupriavidus taiwanensis]SOZ84389.1 hypothetical protein CBM2622_A80068 [Cupriavidus taiwanensis]
MTNEQAAARQAAQQNLTHELTEALQWTASALQAATNGGSAAHEKDLISMKDGSGAKTIGQILDQADAALGRAKEPQ